MSPGTPLDILRHTGALLEGHFLLPDGAHSGSLLRVAKALQFAPFNRKLCYEIVRHFLELDIHAIVAASIGAIPAAVEIGRQLEARAIFVEEAGDEIELRRGFELHEGERVVLVEDLLRDDRALDRHAALVRRADTRLIGVGSIVDARTTKTRLMVRDVSAVRLRAESFSPDLCPLCAEGLPLSSL
jgi:orotate phosphoribosyltransferase